MRAIDTNVLVRLVTRDDAEQVRAAEAFIEKGAWVSLIVLVETTWVLRAAYKLGADEIATAVEMLLRHKDLTLQDPDVVALALELVRRKPAVELSDCLILEIARKAGHIPLGTFDKSLGKREGAQRL